MSTNAPRIKEKHDIGNLLNLYPQNCRKTSKEKPYLVNDYTKGSSRLWKYANSRRTQTCNQHKNYRRSMIVSIYKIITIKCHNTREKDTELKIMYEG